MIFSHSEPMCMYGGVWVPAIRARGPCNVSDWRGQSKWDQELEHPSVSNWKEQNPAATTGQRVLEDSCWKHLHFFCCYFFYWWVSGYVSVWFFSPLPDVHPEPPEIDTAWDPGAVCVHVSAHRHTVELFGSVCIYVCVAHLYPHASAYWEYVLFCCIWGKSCSSLQIPSYLIKFFKLDELIVILPCTFPLHPHQKKFPVTTEQTLPGRCLPPRSFPHALSQIPLLCPHSSPVHPRHGSAGRLPSLRRAGSDELQVAQHSPVSGTWPGLGAGSNQLQPSCSAPHRRAAPCSPFRSRVHPGILHSLLAPWPEGHVQTAGQQ